MANPNERLVELLSTLNVEQQDTGSNIYSEFEAAGGHCPHFS
jgi:hypothetical protein